MAGLLGIIYTEISAISYKSDFCEYDSWNHMVLFCITPPGEEGHDKDYYAKVEFAPISHVGDLPKSGGLLAGISDDEIFAGLDHLN